MAADNSTPRLAILGAGVMGASIATLAVGQGVPVVLVDVSVGILDQARSRIDRQLRHAQLMGALPRDQARGELTTAVSIEDAADATAVIEAITEQPAMKAEVLAEVSVAVRPGTPIISNTSGIPIDEMAGWVAHPADLAGAHFMNPPYLITMVEVVRGRRTAETTLRKVTDLMAALGRQAIVVRDNPGFVTSRLLHPMINDAARIVGEGIASAEAVDALMQGGLGHPTGPLRTADLIGLDNLVDSLNVLHERTEEESYRPCALLLEKVSEGSLGRKTGHGFYDDYGKDFS